MQTRQLGNSDLTITRIGLGTWAIGSGGWQFAWGPQNEAESIATIHAALETGINWIDTAAVYGLGVSEEVVGKALRTWKDTGPYIFTKGGRVPRPDGSIGKCLRRESMVQECEDSLRRLGIDCIDLYQIHWPEPDEEIEEGWAAVSELIDSGKVRWGGVSNFSVLQMRRCQGLREIISLQPPFSLLRPEVSQEILPFCMEENIGVIVYSPMQKGLLTGKVTPEWVAALPEDDHRKHKDAMFQSPRLKKIQAQVNALGEIAAELTTTTARLAIAWTLHQPGVTAAIVGARHADQPGETASAAELHLSEDVLARIDGIFL